MRVPPFKLDAWLAEHEFATPPIRYNLASSTGPQWTLGELMALGGGSLAGLREVKLSYAPLVKKGSYLVVMDTAIEDVPAELFPDRPWGKGNSPKTAVHEFLRTTDRFRIDKDMEAKLLITVAPDGYLECVKD